MTASTDTTSALLHDVLAQLADVVAEIAPSQSADPTPCAEFDVAELRRHVLGWLSLFADGFADPAGRGRADIDDHTVGDDPAADVRNAAEKLAAAVKDGAAERMLYLGDAGMPGETALQMILWEYLVHGWDLAAATGRAWNPPAAAVAETLDFVPGMLTDDYQGEGKPFAPALPIADDAPPLHRLLARCGRNPGWAR